MLDLEERLEQFGRLVDTQAKHEEKEAERSLRPKSFDEYIGQTEVKENLKVIVSKGKSLQAITNTV